MAYVIPGGTIPSSSGNIFPLSPPSGYSRWRTMFYPGWQSASGQVDWAEFRFFTTDFFGLGGISSQWFTDLGQRFAAAGEGEPLAMRIFERDLFDVIVPDHFCLPSILGGDCIDTPWIGGQNVASGKQYVVQVIYHNAIQLAGVWAFLVIFLGFIAVAYVVESMTGGSVNLSAGVKEGLEALGDAVGQGLGGVAWLFIGVTGF